jgi:hypothetical protein
MFFFFVFFVFCFLKVKIEEKPILLLFILYKLKEI